MGRGLNGKAGRENETMILWCVPRRSGTIRTNPKNAGKPQKAYENHNVLIVF